MLRPEALGGFRAGVAALRIAPQWRAPLLSLAIVWAALLVLFAPAFAAMARQWIDSSTYNHILLVPLILCWLVWTRAAPLAELSPRACWPCLIVFAGALLVWLVGDISGLALAHQAGAVMALQASVLVVLGPRVAWALAFVLGYALFLVPFGDELVPSLQMITATITIWLTQASGVPAVIDGVFIDTPAGLFEVAEACSGVKFLVAMVALGALVAHVCFCSWRRRLVFMAAAVVLPILANGVRAWGTVFIAQSQGIAFAAGFDHIFYGWVFFALVMGGLLAGAWRWFDRPADAPFIDSRAIAALAWPRRLEHLALPQAGAVAAMVTLALVAQGWANLASHVEARLPARIALAAVPGWSPVTPAHDHPWEPQIVDADLLHRASLRDDRGQVVDLVFAAYGAQAEGREAGAYGQGAQPPGSEWRWLSPEPPIARAQGLRMQALGRHQRVAMTWFRHGDWLGGSRPGLQWRAMIDRLLLRPRPTAMLILSAGHEEGEMAHRAIADFVAAAGPLDAWMDAALQPD